MKISWIGSSIQVAPGCTSDTGEGMSDVEERVRGPIVGGATAIWDCIVQSRYAQYTSPGSMMRRGSSGSGGGMHATSPEARSARVPRRNAAEVWRDRRAVYRALIAPKSTPNGA